MQRDHFRISSDAADEEKLNREKKRKTRRILQACFAVLLTLFAIDLLLASIFLATGRLGWNESGLVLNPRSETSQQPAAADENTSDMEAPSIDFTLPEVGPSLPGDAIEITPTAPTASSISGIRKPDVGDPQSFVPSPLYCTIWPTKNLTIYSDATCSNEIGTAYASSMYCVLEEDTYSKLFRVRTGVGESGWIDSNYCMINLPEYLGDLCSYNITNSYSSMYTIHEYEIPGLTGRVIAGYENVKLADGSYLVPFLYPCCTKLVNAAKQALASGYRIKIYDSYRPKTATNAIYYTAVGIIDSPLPDQTYTGNSVKLPQPPASDGGYQRNYLIYRDLIELNGWDMGSFLAPGASRHNMGVALDMTFEDAATGEEVSAQTVIHDLSAYSTIRSNNKIASTMYKLMEGCKMHNIVSEWWHFQDNEAMNSLKPPYCEDGVSAEGWIADERGERFRLADGTVLRSCMMVVNEGSLYFDADGYLLP